MKSDLFGVAVSPRTRTLKTQLERIARRREPAALLGEMGVGKTHSAAYVHHRSGRGGYYVPINCSRFRGTPELMRSELFGHAKGAFTGAMSNEDGAFVRACGGTVLLDEIHELTPSLQAQLLTVLLEGRIEPIGRAAVHVDVRVIVATNRGIDALIPDLAARIVFPILVPPLRERREDIPELVVELLATEPAIERVTTSALKELRSYDWPCNLHGLKRVIQFAVTFAEANVIDSSDVKRAIRQFDSRSARTGGADATIAALELAAIEELTMKRLRAATGLSKSTCIRALRALVQRGRLEIVGSGRQRRYKSVAAMLPQPCSKRLQKAPKGSKEKSAQVSDFAG